MFGGRSKIEKVAPTADTPRAGLYSPERMLSKRTADSDIHENTDYSCNHIKHVQNHVIFCFHTHMMLG